MRAMSAMALDAAPAAEQLELAIPGGGGPGDIGPFDDGGGGGGGRDDDDARSAALYGLGILLILVAIFAFFSALAIVFIARSRTPVLWRPIAVPKLLWLSTALLVLSSGWLEAARKALALRRAALYRSRLLTAALLGLAFLGCQLASMYQLAWQGVYARENPHATLYYLFTGIHGAHILGGLIALNWVVLHSRRTWRGEQAVSATVTTYWHFMDLVWVGLFGLLLAL